jgi:hypothetical protein
VTGIAAGVAAGFKLAGSVFDVVDPVRKVRQDAAAATTRVKAVVASPTHQGLPVRLADPYSIGVLASAAAEEQRRQPGADRPPYIERSVDTALRQAIAALGTSGGVVVVKGPVKAGKSRTLWEALAATPATRDRHLYAIRQPYGRDQDGGTSPFATILEQDLDLNGPSTVIWVDDAHAHFEYGLTWTRLQQLLARYPGVIVAMTVHTNLLDVSAWTAARKLLRRRHPILRRRIGVRPR